MSAGVDAPLEAGLLMRELGMRFEDPSLLERALTHRSYAFEHGGIATNERLEFLGDAVLSLVVTDELYHAHPDAPEGELAKLRAAAVKTASLASMARQIGLGRFVRLGKGEAASGGADKSSILADTFEAVLGAYYLDRGYPEVYDLVRDLFGARLADLAGRGASLDYKTSLQELVAARFESMPRYQVSDRGPDHEKEFTAEVTVDGDVVGRGVGRSKKAAEQRAAREAYLALTSAD